MIIHNVYDIKIVIATKEKLLLEIKGKSYNSFTEALEKCFSDSLLNEFQVLDESLIFRVWIEQETLDVECGVVGRCRFLIDTENKTYKPEN
jgi:hypothetical protein